MQILVDIKYRNPISKAHSELVGLSLYQAYQASITTFPQCRATDTLIALYESVVENPDKFISMMSHGYLTFTVYKKDVLSDPTNPAGETPPATERQSQIKI